jgi:hypothetical protein
LGDFGAPGIDVRLAGDVDAEIGLRRGEQRGDVARVSACEFGGDAG